jgi:hypothetical protein
LPKAEKPHQQQSHWPLHLLVKAAEMAVAAHTATAELEVVVVPADIQAPAEMGELAATLDKTVVEVVVAVVVAVETPAAVTQLPEVAAELAFTVKVKMEPAARAAMVALLISELLEPEAVMALLESVEMQDRMAEVAPVYVLQVPELH